MICDRCREEIEVFVMSIFNTDTLCLDCKNKEKNHPDYEIAVKREKEEVEKGNLNFEGIGKPEEL